MLITVVQIFVLIATIGIGLFSFISPGRAADFTGLQLPGPRGTTEMRSIFGGLFIGLGVAPILLSSTGAYQTVAITYLGIGVARLLALVMDKSADQSNWVSLVSEFVFGFLLLL